MALPFFASFVGGVGMNDNMETSQQPENETAADQSAATDQTDQAQSPAGSQTNETPVNPGNDTSEQLKAVNDKLDQMIQFMTKEPETVSSQVYLRNGDQFEFLNQVTLGESLIAAGIFLVLSFQVIKWILDLAWKKGR